MRTIYFLFFFSFCTPLFAANFIEQFLFEVEYKDRVLHGSKVPSVRADIECPKRLKMAQDSWQKNSQKRQDGLILEGELSAPFTKEEIINMKNENLHGITGKIRGTDKVLSGGLSYGGMPVFPHTVPGCEKYFKEDVTIKEIGGKNCREIKLSDEKNNLAYTQVYCEGSTNIFINASPTLTPASSCFAGKDLVNCR